MQEKREMKQFSASVALSRLQQVAQAAQTDRQSNRESTV